VKEERFYRQSYKANDLIYFHVEIEQTDLDIAAEHNLRKEALEFVKIYRGQIIDYIKKVPEFLTSLVPLDCSAKEAEIIRRMHYAAKKAGVGPMAAVAGAVSEFVGRDLLKFSREIIVENGGDIFIKSDRDRIVGLYAGDSPLSNKIGLKILAADTPMGVCTSSGRIGHSLSFGNAHAAVILSRDTLLADAVATAVGNKVKEIKDIEKAIGFAKSIDGVDGVVIIIDDKIGVWGNINLVKL
jgi:ApbE superfamily uncharacterized protein (UPF0280 family)